MSLGLAIDSLNIFAKNSDDVLRMGWRETTEAIGKQTDELAETASKQVKSTGESFTKSLDTASSKLSSSAGSDLVTHNSGKTTRETTEEILRMNNKTNSGPNISYGNSMPVEAENIKSQQKIAQESLNNATGATGNMEREAVQQKGWLESAADSFLKQNSNKGFGQAMSDWDRTMGKYNSLGNGNTIRAGLSTAGSEISNLKNSRKAMLAGGGMLGFRGATGGGPFRNGSGERDIMGVPFL